MRRFQKKIEAELRNYPSIVGIPLFFRLYDVLFAVYLGHAPMVVHPDELSFFLKFVSG